ncbi:MAG: DUF151 domain-containing protein [Corynebacterium sp.]|nr:DUF151 domain-containing protein [Corynebacterium sp.]
MFSTPTENFQAIVLRGVAEPQKIIVLWVPLAVAENLEARRQDFPPRRPDTYDLLTDVWCASLREVSICSYYAGMYLADIVFQDDRRVDAKPSDAVMIAQILHLPITIDEEVFRKTAIFAGDSSIDELFEHGPNVVDTPETDMDVDGFLDELFGKEL